MDVSTDPSGRILVVPLTVCLTFDFDAVCVWLHTNNPSAISRGEFGAVAVPRILGLLEKHKIPATFFVPGHTALSFPVVTKRIVDEGHELGHHGWVHENPANVDADTEREALEKGLEALEKVGGERPTGWRSPSWNMSPRSIDLLIEYRFRYDSSLMGSDFHPYWVRKGDRWDEIPYHFGERSDLVELPVYWGLDDFPAFSFVPGRNEGLRSPTDVEEIWRGDFDYAYRDHAGGVYTLTMHPQVIGRGHRFLMLERLIEHIASHDNVTFSTMRDAAEAWRNAQE